MHIRIITLAALIAVGHALPTKAGTIVWRPATAGVLATAAPTTPGAPANFGVSYGSSPVTVRAGTRVSIMPEANDGFPALGYTFSGGNLPAGIGVEANTGMITGKFQTAGTYFVDVVISRDGQSETIRATIIVV